MRAAFDFARAGSNCFIMSTNADGVTPVQAHFVTVATSTSFSSWPDEDGVVYEFSWLKGKVIFIKQLVFSPDLKNLRLFNPYCKFT